MVAAESSTTPKGVSLELYVLCSVCALDIALVLPCVLLCPVGHDGCCAGRNQGYRVG